MRATSVFFVLVALVGGSLNAFAVREGEDEQGKVKKCHYDAKSILLDEEFKRQAHRHGFRGPYFDESGTLPEKVTVEECIQHSQASVCGRTLDIYYERCVTIDIPIRDQFGRVIGVRHETRCDRKRTHGKVASVEMKWGGFLGIGATKRMIECNNLE